jgi:WNT inhibitory factor 1
MRLDAAILTAAAVVAMAFLNTALARHQHYLKSNQQSDISLWIDQEQIMMLSGIVMEIYVIAEGDVVSHLLDPDFENKVPIIPSEVSHVNFTWKSGTKRYYYNFYRLKSFDKSILKTPLITIRQQGRIPKKPKKFSILLPCTGNPGIAQFEITLSIETPKKEPLNGTPLSLLLRKECNMRGSNSCPKGYLESPNCKTAFCYPNCMNGGNCTAPGKCSCPAGYHGPYCEGGICLNRCLNGGKCMRKDECKCPTGYFGLRCEFSKCTIPCLHGGKCKGNNICKCRKGFRGNHCEIDEHSSQRSVCNKTCRNGICQLDNTCLCNPGWFGRLCNKNKTLI